MKKVKEEEIIPPLDIYGEGKKNILIINGIHDATYNLGKSKEERFLRKTLLQLDLDSDEDAYYTALFNSNEVKSAKALAIKRKSLDTVIKRIRPSTIILVGELPYRALLYPRMVGRIAGMGYSAFIGEKIPDQELGCFVCPIEGIEELLATKQWSDGKQSPPAYELDPSIYADWQKHLKQAFTEEAFPSIENKVVTAQTEYEAIQFIHKVMQAKIVSFDYETTGLKPYRKGQKIVSISLSDGEYSYSFPYFDTFTFKEAFKKFLVSDIKKISHNLQFEAIWSKHIFGVWPTNWYWDTMIVQHCLNNNQPVGLKYLTYCKLGIIGYDDSIDGYIKSLEEEKEKYGDNAFNRITEAPIEELLEYNALDSLYTYYIYKQQKNQIACSDYDYLPGIKFATETHTTFAKMSYQGMCIDEEYLQKTGEDLQRQMAIIADKIMQSDEVKQWDDPNEPFNFGSSKQLSHLLFDILKIVPIAKTEKNAPSVDKINLPKYDLPFIKDILDYRKLSKVYDTYIKSILREAVDGKVHSHLSLSNVKTYRSSCQGPNLQNNPKRDPETKKFIRRALKPSPGHKIVEYDHAQLEVRIAACHNKDQNLIKYIMNPEHDMHRDSAMDGYLLKKEEVTKEIRQSIKSDFVFAEFYGSYYPSIAYSMWQRAEELNLREHLKTKGIHNYKQFENHIKRMEEKFWDERFPTYKRWRKDTYEFYKTHGYVEQKTGFKCVSPMKRNNAYNSPGQGDAAHVLLWGMNKVDQALESRGMNSKVVLEIHDSLVIDLGPTEEKVVDYLVWLYCTQRVVEWWDWINIPLMMEKEASEVDGNWAETKGYGYIGESK